MKLQGLVQFWTSTVITGANMLLNALLSRKYSRNTYRWIVDNNQSRRKREWMLNKLNSTRTKQTDQLRKGILTGRASFMVWKAKRTPLWKAHNIDTN